MRHLLVNRNRYGAINSNGKQIDVDLHCLRSAGLTQTDLTCALGIYNMYRCIEWKGNAQMLHAPKILKTVLRDGQLPVPLIINPRLRRRLFRDIRSPIPRLGKRTTPIPNHRSIPTPLGFILRLIPALIATRFGKVVPLTDIARGDGRTVTYTSRVRVTESQDFASRGMRTTEVG